MHKEKKAGLGGLPSLLTELTYEKPNLTYKHIMLGIVRAMVNLFLQKLYNQWILNIKTFELSLRQK
jgi:hypothetical protein